eukprot:scaffold204173_cov19-Prasinocladus_malaysianus.AAC.3
MNVVRRVCAYVVAQQRTVRYRSIIHAPRLRFVVVMHVRTQGDETATYHTNALTPDTTCAVPTSHLPRPGWSST